jgi:putative NADH-flavin reductase
MNILVIGATGNAGSRIVAEALSRGHQVITASRRPCETGMNSGARHVVLDAADPGRVAEVARGHDAIVGATRPAHGREADVGASTRGLVEGAQLSGVRLLVVGGAAPLRVPGTNRHAIDDPDWVPAQIRPIAQASVDQLTVLQHSTSTDWTYLAPAALFHPGERTGTYRTGGHDLVIADDGTSFISSEDYAIALLDELERPTTNRGVLSVGT